MSKMFDYISGQADGKIAELEAREEYALGHLEAQLKENEIFRAEIERLKIQVIERDSAIAGWIKREAATIERCAQVADKYESVYGFLVPREIAAAIRALKDKP